MMKPHLHRIVVAFANLSDTELHTLIAATYGVPQTAPGSFRTLPTVADGLNVLLRIAR